jgi:orotate phosphoribosyltransferase
MQKNKLLQTIKKYIINQPLKTKSGIELPFYCNLREISAHSKDFKIITEAIGKLILEKYPDLEGLVCVPYGSVLMTGALSYFVAKPAMVYRKEVKNYGAGGDKVGVLKISSKVVIVEDVVTSGTSVLEVVDKLKQDGYEVLGVVSIISHELEASKTLFQKLNLPFYPLLKTSEF